MWKSRKLVGNSSRNYCFYFTPVNTFIVIVKVEYSNFGNFKIELLEKLSDTFDLSCFFGNLRRDEREDTRDCWRISDGNNFRVRSKHFIYDKSKV